jgi:undecaprenyl-diphosphatase
MMKRLSPFKPLLLPATLMLLFATLASSYKLLTWFDSSIISTVRLLPHTLTPFMNAVSVLGNFYEDILIIIIVTSWELLRRNYNRALVTALTLAAFPLFFIVKETVSRARPADKLVIATGLPGYSFPSGHAVTSAAAFGILAILAYSHLPKPWKQIVFSACLLLIFVIGVSRIYLGAHYPTDVLGGWLLALTVLSALRGLSIYIAERTGHRASTTTEDPEGAKV